MTKRKGRATSKAQLRASDIKDIESKLEIVRTDRILSGKPIAEKADSELFFLDQTGITSTDGGEERKKLKERGLILDKPLRIDEILRPQSKVEPLRTTREGGRTNAGEKFLIDRKVKSLNSKTLNPPSCPAKSSNDKSFDIWTDDTVHQTGTTFTKRRPPHSMKPPVISLAAIEIPHAGSSYRPIIDEHKKLWEEASKTELLLNSNEQAARLCKVLSKNVFGPVESSFDLAVKETLEGNDNEEPSPLTTGLNESSTLETFSSLDSLVPTKPKLNRKKTEKERKRLAKHRGLLQKQIVKSKEKRISADLHRLNQIEAQVKKELAEKVMEQNIQREIRMTKRQHHISILRRLGGGRTDFKPMPIVVQPPEELSNSLRTMKPRGNLVIDRFKSLQQRALIEPINNPLSLTSRPKSRKRVKLFEPRSHKEFV